MTLKLSKFLKCTSGNTAMMLALAALPLSLAVGSAVDYVRAVQTQTVLQAAVDSAALAGSSNLEMGDDEMKSLIKDYLVANGVEDAVAEITKVSVTVNRQTENIAVDVNGKLNTSLMRLAGISSIEIAARSEVVQGGKALELVLVLDNTGSMDGQKLTDLKAAAKDLVETLFEDQGASPRLKIGVVPFSEYVNIGTAASGIWLDSNVQPAGEVWQGCVGSRPNPDNTNISNAGISAYVAVGGVECVQPLLDLTTVRANIDAKLDSMTANGNTYIPAGLIWGWNMLDQDVPLTKAVSPAQAQLKNLKKAVVLMTDGDNTISVNAPFHDGADRAASDLLTADICANVKAAGLMVYTVAFQVSNVVTKGMLETCATEPSMAFDATNSAALKMAFSTIATQLSQTFLAK